MRLWNGREAHGTSGGKERKRKSKGSVVLKAKR